MESLQRERDEFKAKVDMQAKELDNVHRNFVCGRCRQGAVSAPHIIALSQLKSAHPVLSNLERLWSSSKAGTARTGRVDLSQQKTRRSTPLKTTLRAEPHLPISRAAAVIQAANPYYPHSSSISESIPSTSLQPPVPTSEESIVFNKNVEKELDVQILHVISHNNKIRCVKFSRDGKYLAAACWDGKAYIYDVVTGMQIRVLKDLFAEDDSKVHTVCFGDGTYLATGLSDGSVYIWEIMSNYVRNAFKGHTNEILRLDFSPNGRLLVSTSYDNSVRLWNMRDGTAKVLIEDDPMTIDEPCYTSACFSPDGRSIVASHRDGVGRIWDARTGYIMRKVQMHRHCAYRVVFMPSGKALITGSGDTTLRYWDISTFNSIKFCARSQTTNDLPEEAQPKLEFSGHTQLVSSVAVSPDGRWVASASHDKTLRVWDTVNGAMQCILNHGDQLTTVGFSPAGNFLVAGETSGTVKIWRYS